MFAAPALIARQAPVRSLRRRFSKRVEKEALGVSCAEQLEMIKSSALNLTVWRRQPAPALIHWLSTDAWKTLPKEGFTLSTTNVEEQLRDYLQENLIPDTPGRRLFLEDLTHLVTLFFSLSGATHLSVRLDPMGEQEGCERFHVDFVSLRLITTYVGPGTQWIPHRAVDYDALESLESTAFVCRDERAIRTLPCFAVGVFKGSSNMSRLATGLVHRSPLCPPGENRLLLSLSPSP